MSATSRYAFLATGRWLGLIAAMVVVSVVCALLGVWQWGRYEVRAAQATQVDDVYDAAPVPLVDALGGAPVVDAGNEWQPVTLTGRYAGGATVLLRNRPVDGTPAVHVLAPFLAELPAGGSLVVVVDRGWTGAGAAESDGAVPAPPDGEVTLTARLRAPEQPVDRTAPVRQVYTLDPAGVLGSAGIDVAGLPVLGGYVAAVAEEPAAQVTLGGYARPQSRYGVNMSYAFQWWFFSAGALAALVILARREAADNAGTRVPRPRRAAEAEEDALVDAQLAADPRYTAGQGPDQAPEPLRRG